MYLWNPLWNLLYRTWLSALIPSYWITQVYNPKDVFLQMYFALICDTILWHSAALWFYVFPTHRLIEHSGQTSSHTSPSSEARVFLMLFCRVQVLLWLRTIQKLALLSIILLCQLWNGNVFWIFLISLLITQSWISAKKITKIEVFPPSLVYGNSKKDNSHKNILEGGAELQWVPKPGTGRRIHFYQDKTKMLYHNIWKFPCCFGPPQHPPEASPGESLTPDPGPWTGSSLACQESDHTTAQTISITLYVKAIHRHTRVVTGWPHSCLASKGPPCQLFPSAHISSLLKEEWKAGGGGGGEWALL